MKKIITLLFITLGLNSFSQLNDPAPYCEIDYWGAHYNMFNTLDIDGTTHSFGPVGDFGTTIPFIYQNSLIFPDLIKGNSSTFTIDFHSIGDGEPQYFGVFIDFNQNNIFDANELIMQNNNTINTALPAFGAPAVTANLNVTIPNTAIVGVTRMRLIRGEDLTPNVWQYDPAFDMVPCYNFQASYGCYYDFDVNIVGNNSSSIINKNLNNTFNFYPNPTQEYINFDNSDLNKTIIIYDIYGKEVLKESMITNKINIKHLSNGIYFISINNNKTIKIIKQ